VRRLSVSFRLFNYNKNIKCKMLLVSVIELQSHLIMSKRTYLSGSEKRKRLAIQKENISKLPKLTSFFTLEETDRQTEFSTSSFQGTSKFESPEIGPTFNDTTSVLSSSAPNLTTAVNTLEFKTSSLSNCDLTNTHIIENISHDLGTYCDDILTEEKRDI
jgi:hypothetical protein